LVERNPGFRPEYKGTFKNTVVISHQQELQYPKDLHFLFCSAELPNLTKCRSWCVLRSNCWGQVQGTEIMLRCS